MIRITVQLSEPQLDAARAQARLQGLSLAGFVRNSLDVQIARSESLVRMVRQRALTAVDKIEAVRSDVAPAATPAATRGAAPGAAPSGVRGPAAGSAPESAGYSTGQHSVPRYWLDYPLDELDE